MRRVSSFANERCVDVTLEPSYGGTLTLYVFREDDKRVRVGDLGDGIKTLLYASVLCNLIKPKLFLWEDVEAHIWLI